jgi:hypothetical protein
MRLTKSRRAARLARLALSELEAIVSDPWSGGQRSERDIEMLMELRQIEAVAMIRRVGSIMGVEGKGDSFSQWWQTTNDDPLYIRVKRIRDLEFKRGDREPGSGTTVIYQYNEDEPAGTTSDPWVMLLSNPSGVLDLLREYLLWCESVLIPEAEQRTL